MKTTKEMIEVMQAYENGEEIEYYTLGINPRWGNTIAPVWDWLAWDYRVKPKVGEDVPKNPISMDKEYTFRNGEHARILCIDKVGGYPVVSLLEHLGSIHLHNLDGSSSSIVNNDFDLIEVIPWVPKDKEPVWAWYVTMKGGRYLRFWDEKNNGVFTIGGVRNGIGLANYAKVENIEPWMLELQKQLQG